MDSQELNSLKIFKNQSHTDDRGIIRFFNDLDLSSIKRCYIIEPSNTEVIRAWQSHKIESKWFYVIDGAFKVVLVKPNDWVKPQTNLPFEKILLHQVAHIPAGYATGFKALVANSKLMVFSDKRLEESLTDDYRFDKELWYNWSCEPQEY